MAPDDPGKLRELILSTIEASLDAQLRAIRRLRVSGPSENATEKRRVGRSQVDMAEDVLRRVGHPLHVSDLIVKIKTSFGIDVDRESLVSALTKKVVRGRRFTRVGPNEFGIRG